MWCRSAEHRQTHGCPMCGRTDQFYFGNQSAAARSNEVEEGAEAGPACCAGESCNSAPGGQGAPAHEDWQHGLPPGYLLRPEFISEFMKG
mmetsp:Transcript_19510/g.57575  ORF Transcript_19510/g.57575 Transcript_19510/m.57575 type:complete len:90 (+) Transcript_19510:1027-1296(+)